MKKRKGFVSNSSSCAFIITNKAKGFDNSKYLVDFVTEVVEQTSIVYYFNDEYALNEDDMITGEQLIQSAKSNNFYIPKGKSQVVFGDEQGTLVGRVFDYTLRVGGKTDTFEWEFGHWLR